MIPRSRARALVRPAVTALLASAMLLGTTGTAAPATVTAPSQATAGVPAQAWGVYTGPGAKNLPGSAAFAQKTGLPITNVVDFPPTSSWAGITGQHWLLDPYRGSGLALEYSLPLLPDGVAADGSAWTLEGCARGEYDAQWATLGRNLVNGDLASTVVRPGWEFNGSWYKWNAAGKVEAFVDCFRRVVTTMRAVPGNSFTFNWNPNLGAGAFPAELAYPGDAYVDVVGIDVYDTSWTWYPTPSGVSVEKARQSAWSWVLNGDHGLTFWSSFARQHGKPMSISEWGVTWRSDGHGGGDNPYFIDRMMDFIADPVNNVVVNHYFNTHSPALSHDLVRSDTIFSAALAALQARAAALAGPAAPTVTPPASPAPVTTTTTITTTTVPATVPAPTSGATGPGAAAPSATTATAQSATAGKTTATTRKEAAQKKTNKKQKKKARAVQRRKKAAKAKATRAARKHRAQQAAAARRAARAG
ncbi:MAG: hypothetical protein QOH75_1696 [Actinomycetota bacterium]|nr:hypothetical protein [Actinomycetota bacterium]